MLSSFYPVVPGRTSDALSRFRTLFQVQSGKLSVQRAEDQLSTGKRFMTPSEDPTAAIRVIGIQRELEFRDQTLRNLNSSQGYLNVTESTLGNVQDVLNEARGIGVEGAGNTSTPQEREGWVSHINASINRLLAAANSKYQDRYLFSGGTVGTPAATIENDRVKFLGNEASLLTIANSGELVSHNVTGQKALGLVSDSVVSTSTLNPIAVDSTKLSDLNGGVGISTGAIMFSDGVDKVTIDLASANTLHDVLERTNGNITLSGHPVQLSLSGGSIVAAYSDGHIGTLRINNVSTGTTATDLGIATTVANPTTPLVGNPLDPLLRPTTLLSQLNGGAGYSSSDSFRIEQNGKTYDIAIGTARTIEDLTNKINQSGASVRADLTPDGRSLRIRSIESGSDFSISENGGTLAAQLGVRTFTGQTRLSQLNFGIGVPQVEGPDFTLKRNDGSSFAVDINGAVTVQDVIDRINAHPDNQTARTKITASINTVGNGLTLSSPEYVVAPGDPPLTTTPGPIQISHTGGSETGWALGLVPKGSSESSATLVSGEYRLIGKDPNPQEVKGIFNSLLRLRDAIEANNPSATARAVELLDGDLSRLSLSRGDLGVQQQRIDNLINFQEETKIELKADESRNFDADLTATISDLTARQVAYEASLKLLANASQMSLFNYL